MTTPKVSVTVPVYNVENFLRQCLDSLKNQTLKDLEFILVDDCSTDGSLAICEEYANDDNRFRVFRHKTNRGSSVARQTGLDNARGEYVIVCDSDDWVEPNMYELLYENAKRYNADISTCDFYTNYSDGRQRIIHQKINTSSQKQLIIDALTQRLPPASWIKMVRRKFIIDNGLYYEKGINQGEDALILLKLLLCNPSIAKIDNSLYHYRRIKNGSSYTANLTFNSFKQLLYIQTWKTNQFRDTIYKNILYNSTVNLGYLGLRVVDMPEGYHEKYLREKISFLGIVTHKCFNLKSLVVIAAKIHRPLGLFIYKHLSGFFYK